MDNDRDAAIRRLAAEHNVSVEHIRNILDANNVSSLGGVPIPPREPGGLRASRRLSFSNTFGTMVNPSSPPLNTDLDFDLDDDILEVNTRDMKSIEKELKKRHLSSEERHALHSPKSDWCETNKGEVCKSASTLDVSDLVIKVT